MHEFRSKGRTINERYGDVSGNLGSPGSLQIVFEVSNLFMCLPQGYAWFTVMFHSTFDVWGMAKFARELKTRSKTVSCVTTFAPNNNEKVKILFCRM